MWRAEPNFCLPRCVIPLPLSPTTHPPHPVPPSLRAGEVEEKDQKSVFLGSEMIGVLRQSRRSSGLH